MKTRSVLSGPARPLVLRRHCARCVRVRCAHALCVFASSMSKRLRACLWRLCGVRVWSATRSWALCLSFRSTRCTLVCVLVPPLVRVRTLCLLCVCAMCVCTMAYIQCTRALCRTRTSPGGMHARVHTATHSTHVRCQGVNHAPCGAVPAFGAGAQHVLRWEGCGRSPSASCACAG